MTIDELIESLQDISDDGYGWQEILTPDGTIITGAEHSVGPDEDLACIKQAGDDD